MSQRDIDMIANEIQWPMYPFLPVKRYKAQGEWPELGVIVSGDGYTVTFGNINDINAATLEQYKAMPDIRYDSPEAVVADGWIVD